MSLHTIIPEFNLGTVLTPAEKAAVAHILHTYTSVKFSIRLPVKREVGSSPLLMNESAGPQILSNYAVEYWSKQCVLCKFDSSMVEILR